MSLTRATLRLLLFLFIGGGFNRVEGSNCDFVSPDITGGHPPKKTDHGFTIFLSGDPEYYVPHETYEVTLKYDNSKKSDSTIATRFIGFLLKSEPTRLGAGAGTFEITDDATIQFLSECPTTLTHTSSNHKSNVTVKWRAPSEGSGCVTFKAIIIEQKNIWYEAEGSLRKTLCEEEYRRDSDFSLCEACSEAKYEISFESLWSRQTHPKDFPSADASFSDIIGVSHSNLFQMWELGAKATEGIKQLAKEGETSILEMDFVNNASYIRTIIKSRGLKHINTKSFAVFRVDRTHHFLSILSKIIPSPDWILGVSNLNLCKDGTWIESIEIPLYPIDAGIDKGMTYKESIPLSKNSWEIMRNITSSYPNDARSPFFGEEIKALASLIVTKKRQYDIPCTPLDSHLCEVSQWTAFSECMGTPCSKGMRTRTREYVLGNIPGSGCSETLIDRQVCTVPCNDNGSSYQRISYRNIKRCEVTPWSEWSSCSPACGKGIRRRTRNYINNSYESRCTVRTSEEESCESYVLCNGKELCAATSWTEWSACSVTCGRGVKTRQRKLLDENNEMRCNVQTLDQQSCKAENEDCILEPEEARKICLMDKAIGPCRGYFPRWYFDKTKRMCMQFIYGGCRGNANNFEQYEQCNSMCKAIRDEQPYMTPAVRSLPEQVIDCQISEWGEWSSCSVTCGRGQIERHRTIKVYPRNGGKKCPKKSTQRKLCIKLPCP